MDGEEKQEIIQEVESIQKRIEQKRRKKAQQYTERGREKELQEYTYLGDILTKAFELKQLLGREKKAKRRYNEEMEEQIANHYEATGT